MAPTKVVAQQAAKLTALRMMKKAEQKFVFTKGQNAQICHNCTLYAGSAGFFLAANNLLSTSIGTGQQQRNGDSIYSQNLQFKIWLSNKLDRPNVMYRIVVLAGEEADMPSGTAAVGAAALSGAEYSGSGDNCMMVHWNRDKFKIIRDIYIQPFGGDYSLEPSATNKEHSRLIEFNVPINKKITYKADSGQVPQGANCYGFFITAYDALATATTDNIASFAFSIKHNFKDL